MILNKFRVNIPQMDVLVGETVPQGSLCRFLVLLEDKRYLNGRDNWLFVGDFRVGFVRLFIFNEASILCRGSTAE